MSLLILAILVGVAFVILTTRAKKNKTAHKTKVRREIYIDSYPFPKRISDKVSSTYPHLNEQQVKTVIEGLRQYFQMCRVAGKQTVSMPSQAVDVAWHEFILFTQDYQIFCKRGFGFFLHHVPAQAMKSKTAAQAGIKRAWRLACKLEALNPSAPTRLPLIFNIDTALQIPNGFYYNLDCDARMQAGNNSGNSYCVTDIGCSSCSSGCSSSSVDGFLGGALFGSLFSSDSTDSGSDSSSSDSSGDSGGSSCSGCGGGGD